MSKMLIITRHYMDDNNGGSNASKGFIWSFGYIYSDCTLIYPEHDGVDSSRFIPVSVKEVPVFDHRSKLRKGLDVYRGRLHRFVDFVKDYLKHEKYDVIVLDHSVTAAGLIDTVKKSGAKVVTLHHNVEADYIKDNESSLLYRIPYDYFAIKAEKDALRLSDINLTLTRNDASVFQKWFEGRNLHLHAVGICEYLWKPYMSFPKTSASNTFVISGSLCFKQSAFPILEFIRRFYPIMQNVSPGCKLIVTGRNPCTEIVNACKIQGIELISNPDNMDDIIKRASVYICPINAGSGIKLRVMDGLKRGMPVICHKVSSVGYETLEKGGALFVYDDEESFKKALQQVASKHFSADEIYSLYRREFSFMSGVNRLKEVLAEEGVL